MAEKIKSGTLVLSTVSTVMLTDYCARVRVTNRDGASAIWFRVDGVNPSNAGDECYVVLPNQTKDVACSDPENPEVKLISTVAAPYTVEGYN